MIDSQCLVRVVFNRGLTAYYMLILSRTFKAMRNTWFQGISLDEFIQNLQFWLFKGDKIDYDGVIIPFIFKLVIYQEFDQLCLHLVETHSAFPSLKPLRSVKLSPPLSAYYPIPPIGCVPHLTLSAARDWLAYYLITLTHYCNSCYLALLSLVDYWHVTVRRARIGPIGVGYCSVIG